MSYPPASHSPPSSQARKAEAKEEGGRGFGNDGVEGVPSTDIVVLQGGEGGSGAERGCGYPARAIGHDRLMVAKIRDGEHREWVARVDRHLVQRISVGIVVWLCSEGIVAIRVAEAYGVANFMNQDTSHDVELCGLSEWCEEREVVDVQVDVGTCDGVAGGGLAIRQRAAVAERVGVDVGESKETSARKD